jgi:transposase-like protein
VDCEKDARRDPNGFFAVGSTGRYRCGSCHENREAVSGPQAELYADEIQALEAAAEQAARAAYQERTGRSLGSLKQTRVQKQIWEQCLADERAKRQGQIDVLLAKRGRVAGRGRPRK